MCTCDMHLNFSYPYTVHVQSKTALVVASATDTPDKYVHKDGADASHNFFMSLETLVSWMAVCPREREPIQTEAAGA